MYDCGYFGDPAGTTFDEAVKNAWGSFQHWKKRERSVVLNHNSELQALLVETIVFYHVACLRQHAFEVYPSLPDSKPHLSIRLQVAMMRSGI